MDIPGTLQIETTAACNASCSFCPHGQRTPLPVKFMDSEHITKLINEAATWPSLGQIIPFLTNEPFADHRMPDILLECRTKLPNSNIVLFTNGSLISQKVVERLKDNRVVIDKMFFSLHHSTPEEYQAELGIPFAKTIDAIHRAIDNGIAKSFCILKVTNYDELQNARFKAFVSKEFPGIETMVSFRYNWKGDIDPLRSYEHTLDIICPRQTSMCVLADGRVALCCMDQNGEHALGDTRKHTLLEIFNSPEALRYRTKTKRENSPCSSCNMR